MISTNPQDRIRDLMGDAGKEEVHARVPWMPAGFLGRVQLSGGIDFVHARKNFELLVVKFKVVSNESPEGEAQRIPVGAVRCWNQKFNPSDAEQLKTAQKNYQIFLARLEGVDPDDVDFRKKIPELSAHAVGGGYEGDELGLETFGIVTKSGQPFTVYQWSE